MMKLMPTGTLVFINSQSSLALWRMTLQTMAAAGFRLRNASYRLYLASYYSTLGSAQATRCKSFLTYASTVLVNGLRRLLLEVTFPSDRLAFRIVALLIVRALAL
jgi:hypothetical protein